MIRIRLLGATSVRVGRTTVKPASAVQFALTLYLAATAGAPVVRARLLELFWPHMDAETARHALRQMLYRLRRAGLVLEESGESLLVGRDAVEADFVAALDPSWGERASDDDLAGAAHFLEDVTLLSLSDFREWIDGLRAQVMASARRALLDRIAVARREGRWSRVEDLSRLCLAIDPLNEQATLARAEALAMSGAKSFALRTLDAYVEDVGDQSREIALPARVLRERIAENFTFIRNVPQAWQRFVGRPAELARCHAVIDEAASGRGATCLVSGASGIGKTRLAQEMLSVAKLRGLSTTSMRLEARDAERALSLFTELVPALLQLPGGAACAPASMRILTQFTRPEDSERAAELAVDAPVIRERIRRAIVDILGAVCDEAPLVVLVDDAHHLDGTSLALLRGL
ncbi:MAG: AAA family ATPase, partial [Gemmatimonadetes bacterium]|nr:AAA family ATPase [Gemmatimonadota bacterium]